MTHNSTRSALVVTIPSFGCSKKPILCSDAASSFRAEPPRSSHYRSDARAPLAPLKILFSRSTTGSLSLPLPEEENHQTPSRHLFPVRLPERALHPTGTHISPTSAFGPRSARVACALVTPFHRRGTHAWLAGANHRLSLSRGFAWRAVNELNRARSAHDRS